MKKHIIWLVLGCIIPLLLILLAPAFGLGSNIYMFILIIALFACHLLIPMHHGWHESHRNKEHQHPTCKIKDEK